VAFVKTANRTTRVREAIGFLGIRSLTEISIFIKPNFKSADPAAGSAHPDVLYMIVFMLQEIGVKMITFGVLSGIGNSPAEMDRIEVFKRADQMGFKHIVSTN
jgi:uncharacterized protein (DUF362 family)